MRTLFPPQLEKSAMFIPYPHSSSQRHAHACPRLRLGHKQRVVLATRMRLGNKYAAFFPFSAGNEYELYIPSLRSCDNSRAGSTQPTLFPWCIIYYSFFSNVKGKFLRSCSYAYVVCYFISDRCPKANPSNLRYIS